MYPTFLWSHVTTAGVGVSFPTVPPGTVHLPKLMKHSSSLCSSWAGTQMQSWHLQIPADIKEHFFSTDEVHATLCADSGSKERAEEEWLHRFILVGFSWKLPNVRSTGDALAMSSKTTLVTRHLQMRQRHAHWPFITFYPTCLFWYRKHYR